MVKRQKAVPPVGQGRVSRALGTSDPRLHRNPQAAQDTAQRYDKTLGIDNKGRIGVKPARGVVEAALGSDSVDLRVVLNKVIAELKAAGLMEGGR